jgi:hypothetical protein
MQFFRRKSNPKPQVQQPELPPIKSSINIEVTKTNGGAITASVRVDQNADVNQLINHMIKSLTELQDSEFPSSAFTFKVED